MLILSGRVSIKMVPVIRRIYDQMLEPKWVLSMGACSSSGGMFANYAVVQGADKFLPVDIHIPGCPPRPEALIYGILKLQRKIFGNPDLGWRERYKAYGTEEEARPGTGPRRGRRPRHTPRAEEQAAADDAELGRGSGLMPDAPGLELIAHEVNGATTARSSARPTSTGRRRLLADPDQIREVLAYLSDAPGHEYRFLASLHGADYLPAEPRFAVHYELLNMPPGRAAPGQGAGAPDAGGGELARDRLDRRASSRPPSSRSVRSTTSSGSSSAATPTCGGS